ncbi:SAV_2336 N-terminal domain-related protein, partial [Moraxella sp.]|uniref:SAV_2336 N-terminal domain-related protein n=1 Tax=Moraxella sp. TaxID=479 RepID=UPI00262B33E8
MITLLIDTLRTNDIEPTAEELADALWFAMQIKPFVAPVIAPISDEKKALSSSAPDTSLQTEYPPSSKDASETQRKIPESYPLYSRTARQTGSQKIGSLPIKTPAATVLPGALSLEKALRPIMRRVASRTHYILDEAATVQRIAEQDIWVPMLQGASERWFDVALIIDHSASMVIWQPIIAEWRSLLERHVAFRNVRTWGMKNEAGQIQLYAGSRPCHRRELIDPLGRRLILIVSDCVAPPWNTVAMTQLLEMWGERNPVAIVQMLPQRLWASSALGKATRVKLQATTPGLVNAQLRAYEDDFLFDDEKPTGIKKTIGIKMPIITLEPESLRFWARMVMGRGDAGTPGVLFESSVNQQDNAPTIQPTTEPTAKQRVQHFYAAASPTAQKLAGYLAAAPLTLPVMQLVQQVMLPQSRQVHLAEVFLGGLLKRVSPQECNPMVMEYDFHEGVRDLMLDYVRVPDAIKVLKEVSEYLNRRMGQPLDFLALLADPTATDGIVINKEKLAFAEIGVKVLGRLGGDYGKLATKFVTEKLEVEPGKQDEIAKAKKEQQTKIRRTYRYTDNDDGTVTDNRTGLI